ncbi:MAG TPA: hypothetical protein VFK06_04765 [Candidatus Angelobacter sp.]|nr:hypothetical protein [Candidatus Angelobacter sp.]
MADIAPSMLANAIMGKLYDVLTNGDATVPKATDSFFSFCSPGIPVDDEDFRFLHQGLTGVVTPQAKAVALGNPSTPSGGGTAAATAPAQPQLTPELLNSLRAQDTNAVYQQAEMLARIVDFVPDVTQVSNKQFAQFAVENNEGTLSDQYELVLKMSQVMAQELDKATQDKIAKFRGLLQTTTQKTNLVTGEVTNVVGPSPLVQAYNTKMAAYDAAALAYNAARVNALAGNDPAAVENWAINASIMRNQVTAAMDDWITNGYKDDYEAIAAYISQVMQRDMSMLKQEYEQDLQNAKLTGISSGSDFYYTALAPADFVQSAGWSRFTFSSGDFSNYAGSSFNNSGFQAQAAGSFLGLFGGGGGASGQQGRSQYNSNFDSNNFSLAFSICQIPIVRPWFKDAYLLSKCWRFDQTNPDFKGRMLSDGGKPPKGTLNAYPTSIVFIKDLYLSLDKSSGAAQFIQQQQSSSEDGGGVVNLGFLCLGGSASHYSNSGYSQQKTNHQWDNQGLSVPGMQIAGFKCRVLASKCPDPDPGITAWV